ncbi:Ger(x)C family spore germination protein [Paenibacillus sp. GSMTC-2017]|uniref:Ger(x)C family spore germination protein n=1 Tax=Paenibacillus sp. GSMTC-2017 TaxID=2794350 RepID=UPI0018D91A06|nr:Ger(x)C family spore germination protein [Paenibacillus sp. GSMTC-2017]MBH5319357.1 Ger(x)C family spore germination protein [Paenibacillus sp. GSMTC-2017]
MITSLALRIIAYLLLCSLGLFILTGCWDRTEVNDLAIVTAAGFDLTEDNKIKLSVQLFAPANSVGGGGSLGAEPSIGLNQSLVESAVGIDSADASAKLQELLSRKLFWGQADVFIISDKLAKSSIKDPLDFLTRHPHPRERANLYISDGPTEGILKWKPNIERNSAEVLREMALIQTGFNITLLETIVSLSDVAGTAIIPTIRMKPSGNKPSPFISGSATFKNLKMNHHYPVKHTRGMIWVRREVKESTLTTMMDGTIGEISINIFRIHSHLKPDVQGGKWRMHLYINAIGNLVENTTKLNSANPKVLKQMEKQFSNSLTSRIDSSIKPVQKANTDVIGFGEQFSRHCPKEWKKNIAQWNEIFPKVETVYHIDVKIQRIGLVGENRSISDKIETDE